ncbi:Protein arginine N-methyltransferase 3 [Frankliniella fusca]|uniref:type I protein arginine methyltransferase n=1 Tax=Frankliniella fusca TaxID=407009 RepID=A0AAE1HPS9_9NEOP|nr:Protein arginine N-methyltransferase 3 [Frankliniella fusca]
MEASEEGVPDLCPNKMDTCDSEDDDNSDTWDETDPPNNQLTKCLFCSKVFTIVEEALEHATADHGFDLPTLKRRFDMDCYSFIKLINYLRLHSMSASDLMCIKQSVWDDDKYMKPTLEDDPWLMYDFDDVETPHSSMMSGDGNGGYLANAENGIVTLSEQHFAELQKKIQALSVEVRVKNSLLEAAAEDMKRMRTVTQELVEGSIPLSSASEKQVDRKVACLTLNEDQSYFDSYAHFGIHLEMLSDTVRTSSYRDALLKNSPVISGRVVLDLGCGSSILSMFAALAGAKKVIGIDQSDIIYNAMDIVRENGLESQITLVKGRLEDTAIPEQKVDLIVSEWMGYFLLFEGMLDSVIYARDTHLAEGGLLLPNRCTMHLIGIDDTGRHKEVVGFWDDVYGFRMSTLAAEVLKEPFVEVVPSSAVATSSHTLVELDLMTCSTKDYSYISSPFKLEALRDTSITAFAGYFDTFFDLPVENISFTTGPLGEPTHWKQTVFYLKTPLLVKKGDVIEGHLLCQRHKKEIRSLEVCITLPGIKQNYCMSSCSVSDS